MEPLPVMKVFRSDESPFSNKGLIWRFPAINCSGYSISDPSHLTSPWVVSIRRWIFRKIMMKVHSIDFESKPPNQYVERIPHKWSWWQLCVSLNMSKYRFVDIPSFQRTIESWHFSSNFETFPHEAEIMSSPYQNQKLNSSECRIFYTSGDLHLFSADKHTSQKQNQQINESRVHFIRGLTTNLSMLPRD